MLGLGTKFISIIIAMLLVLGVGSFVLFQSFESSPEPSPKTVVSELISGPAPTTTDSIQGTVPIEDSDPEEDESPISTPPPTPPPATPPPSPLLESELEPEPPQTLPLPQVINPPQPSSPPQTTIEQFTIAEPQVWVPDSMTQPVPPGASKTRLTSLPAPIDKIILTKIGAFGSHQGAHIEGLDHEWIEIEDGTPIGSWGDGEVARIHGGKADDPSSVWGIVINFGDGLWGEYMEIKTPLVKVGDKVIAGQPIGYGVPAYTSPGYHSGEFILADEHRRDGVQAWIVHEGSAVSPFDYLQEDIKQILIDEFTKQVIEPYIAKGQSIETVSPWEPYLTNPMLIHKNHKGTLVGEWLLKSKAWEVEGIYEMITFLSPTKYYPHQRAIAIDTGQNDKLINYFSGPLEVDYTTKRLVIETDIGTMYGIFELDESGPRATLKLEFKTGSYPETFSESHNIYMERDAIGAREDGYNLGARSSPY